MPFNGAGVFSRLFNWQQDRDAGIKILADRMDQEMDGFATGLSNTIARDGQSTVSANIPFNNRKITGLGNATDPGDALNRATGDARYILDDDDTVKTANIEDGAVTNAKLAQMAEATFKGRAAGDGLGDASDLTVTETISTLGLVFGQCRLTFDSPNLRLNRFNGRLITINGVAEEIPSSGVALAATGLTVGTLYYIYAWMNSGTMTLEASTTAPATHTDGTQIKTGDATRALVGMARPITGPAWVDSATQRFVRSWHNDPGVFGRNRFTAARSTTSTSAVELNTEIRVEFLVWSGEAVHASANGCHQNNGTNNTYTQIVYDGTTESTPRYGFSVARESSAAPSSIGISYTRRNLSEGYHYATLFGFVSAGTGQWQGQTPDTDSHPTLEIDCRGV